MTELESCLMNLGIQPMNGDVHVPVSASEIHELEQEIKGQLPDDYRRFLRQYGMSVFENAVGYPAPNSQGLLPFAYFYGANESGNGVLSNFKFYRGQFPYGVIPIGEDGLGNLFCMATDPNNRHVYYWDHGTGWERDADSYEGEGESVPDSIKYTCLEKLASSFTAFVLGLRPDED